MSNNLKVIVYLCVACMFFLLQVSESSALNTIKPSLGAQITYDDNIVFSSVYQIDDWIYEIFPGIDLGHEDELNKIHLGVRGHGQHYDTENQLDTFDVNINLDAARQQTERLRFSLNGRYARDTTLDQTLLETGTLLQRSNRQLYSVLPGLDWNISEKSAISLSLPYNSVNYDREGLVDYDTIYLYLTYSYLLPDEKTKLLIQPDAGRLNFDTGDYSTADCMFGLERNMTERLYGRILAGFNYTHAKSDIMKVVYLHDGYFYLKKGVDVNNYWGWVAEGELTWLWNSGNLDAVFTRRVSGSGYGEPVLNTRFVPSVNWRITERLDSRLAAGISRIESNNDLRGYDYTTYSVRPSITYRVTRTVDIGLHYTYEYLDDRRWSDNRDRNRVFLRLDIKNFNLNLEF